MLKEREDQSCDSAADAPAISNLLLVEILCFFGFFTFITCISWQIRLLLKWNEADFMYSAH